MQRHTALAIAAALGACGHSDDLGTLDQSMIGGSASSCYPQVVDIGGCMGTLIDATHVLTAAHCVVFGGDVNAPTYAQGVAGLANVSKIYVKPAYNVCQPGGVNFANASGHDLAVLKLDRPMLPPGLAPANVGSNSIPPGNPAQAIGWGKPDYDRKLGSFTARSSSIPGTVEMQGQGAGMCPGDSGAAFFTGGDCSGQPPPNIRAIESSQPLGVDQGADCRLNNRSVTANVAEPTNRDFIAAAKSGNATEFDPDAPLNQCCTPGNSRTCNLRGTQTCGSNGLWGACITPTTCGNRICESGETPQNCPIDCASCNQSSCDATCAAQRVCGTCSNYGDPGAAKYRGICSGTTCFCDPVPGFCRACL